ncbi:ABC transporter ATP-binding protein [Eubacteriales bacterium OttesenSCG-928-M02]|nr:ABC transporter ATP-binding protein [Eubacteriales bacterium OttesenSCG-928-M02]
MAIVQVEHLSKVYGAGDTAVKALDNVSFSVEEGEFIAIMGASGSGKSTLMHLLGGVDRPSDGKVILGGDDIYQLDEDALAAFRRRNVGLVYQFYNLIPVLNVEENISLPWLLDDRPVDQARLDEIIQVLGLADRKSHLPNQLSGGQQQRVSIGRALINQPAILLADEPTGNLDTKNSKEIMDLLLLSNQQYNQTLFVITHDERIASMASRILTMEDGRIIRDEVI